MCSELDNEEGIVAVIKSQFKGMLYITVNVENRDSQRVGHIIDIIYCDHIARCRWYKQGGYYQVWHRRERNIKGKPVPKIEETKTLYCLRTPDDARLFCDWYKQGLAFSSPNMTN